MSLILWGIFHDAAILNLVDSIQLKWLKSNEKGNQLQALPRICRAYILQRARPYPLCIVVFRREDSHRFP